MQRMAGSLVMLLLIGFGLWYFVGPGSDMSGCYVGQNANQAFLVQIVESTGGQLSGFYEEAQLNTDGTVSKDNIPLTGARDGKTFTVTLTPDGFVHFFTGSVSLSGTYTGSAISLSGASSAFSANLNLPKANAAIFQSDLAALSAKAQDIQAEQAAAAQRAQELAAQRAEFKRAAAAAQDLETRIGNDLRFISTVPASVSTRVAQLNAQAQEIRNVTGKMEAALEREALLGGFQTADGSQISFSLNQKNMSEDNFITGLQNHFDFIQQNGIPAWLQKVQAHDITCQQMGATVAGQSSFVGPLNELHACIELENATPALQAETNQLLAAYQNVFSVWATENPKQQTIISESSH